MNRDIMMNRDIVTINATLGVVSPRRTHLRIERSTVPEASQIHWINFNW